MKTRVEAAVVDMQEHRPTLTRKPGLLGPGLFDPDFAKPLSPSNGPICTGNK